MRYSTLLLGFLIGFLLSCNQNPVQKTIHNLDKEKYTGKIIDMHMHTGLPHEIPAGTPSICRPSPCEGDGHATVDPKELLEKTLAAMEEYNISKAFLSGVDWSAVQTWTEKAPTRFIASPFILKADNNQLDQLREKYSSGDFKGMGEIGTQLNGIPPNDPSLVPYFDLAEELELPVLIHTLGIGPYMPHFRPSAGNPLLLEEVLINHPKLRLFVENAGFPYLEEMVAMMYQYPQLYADLSTITWVIPRQTFYDYLEGLIRAGLGKRLMFGSDQMVWPEKIGAAVEAIDQAPFLSTEQKEDIFYNNAATFLRLKNTVEGQIN
ncbi:amidohydrolase [Echinicola marina]|uniref:amidohydrolase family protein n=1 Tax=Echinicola marina TaxID=2859768 RepID=UPI001CF6D5B3|nr:amidohydrolase family protein [Echinicola marina]UCS95518.1 amidohydrolase [Echinicola marina]